IGWLTLSRSKKREVASEIRRAQISEGGSDMSEIKISVVDNAVSTETRDVSVGKILQATRTGGKKLKEQVTQIRNRMEMELTRTGDFQKAKKAVEGLKKQLPGITWSARLKTRDKDVPLAEKLIAHSGLMCADLDSLGSNKAAVHAKLKTSHHVFALFVSPSGDGLKAIFRVPADASKHAGSFRAVERHVLDLTGI